VVSLPPRRNRMHVCPVRMLPEAVRRLASARAEAGHVAAMAAVAARDRERERGGVRMMRLRMEISLK